MWNLSSVTRRTPEAPEGQLTSLRLLPPPPSPPPPPLRPPPPRQPSPPSRRNRTRKWTTDRWGHRCCCCRLVTCRVSSAPSAGDRRHPRGYFSSCRLIIYSCSSQWAASYGRGLGPREKYIWVLTFFLRILHNFSHVALIFFRTTTCQSNTQNLLFKIFFKSYSMINR